MRNYYESLQKGKLTLHKSLKSRDVCRGVNPVQETENTENLLFSLHKTTEKQKNVEKKHKIPRNRNPRDFLTIIQGRLTYL